MKRLLLLCAIALLPVSSFRATAQVPPPPTAPTMQTSTVVVTGRVVNGSRRDANVANTTIKFVKAEAGAANGAPIGVAKTLADGVFRASLNAANNDIIFARIDWQGYPYLFPVFDGANQLGANISAAGQILRLFDTAVASPTGLNILSHTVTLKGDPGHLHVAEQIIVENRSDKTVIGSKDAGYITFGLSLPKGASEVHIDANDPDTQLVVLGKDKNKSYAIAKPILPQLAGGNPLNNAVTVNYEIKWERTMDLSRRVLYPTKFFSVARGGNDTKNLVVESPQLGEARKPEVAMGGTTADSLVNTVGRPMSETPAIKRDEMLQLRITRTTKPIIWAFFGLLIMLCVFVPGAMIWGRKARRSQLAVAHKVNEYSSATPHTAKSEEPSDTASVYAGTHSQNEAEVSPDRVQHLIDKIAELDNNWQNRQLSQQDYQAQRASLKQQLVSEMRASRP